MCAPPLPAPTRPPSLQTASMTGTFMTCCNDSRPSSLEELNAYLADQGGGFLAFNQNPTSVLYRPRAFPPWNNSVDFRSLSFDYGDNASLYEANVYTPNYANML